MAFLCITEKKGVNGINPFMPTGASLGQQMLNAPVGINGWWNDRNQTFRNSAKHRNTNHISVRNLITLQQIFGITTCFEAFLFLLQQILKLFCFYHNRFWSFSVFIATDFESFLFLSQQILNIFCFYHNRFWIFSVFITKDFEAFLILKQWNGWIS